ncbi:MAG: hypothetical protein HOW73_36885 [Polyangiaceae bacterium]|nr:hypothetical protein [Polyangiaceae bacterium]
MVSFEGAEDLWATADANGARYIALTFVGSAELGGEKISSFDNDSGDILVAKFDSDCELQWWRVYGAPYLQRARAISIRNDGEIWLAGEVTVGIVLDPHTLTGSGGFVARISSEGDVLSAELFDGISIERVAPAPDDGLLLLTDDNGTLGTDLTFRRLDPLGAEIWSAPFDGDNLHFAFGADGRIAGVASFDFNGDLDLSQVGGPVLTVGEGASHTHAYLFLLDGMGQYVDGHQLDAQNVGIQSLHGDDRGGYVVAATVVGDVAVDGQVSLPVGTGNDVWLGRLAPNLAVTTIGRLGVVGSDSAPVSGRDISVAAAGPAEGGERMLVWSGGSISDGNGAPFEIEGDSTGAFQYLLELDDAAELLDARPILRAEAWSLPEHNGHSAGVVHLESNSTLRLFSP